jgi:hypothetical protein
MFGHDDTQDDTNDNQATYGAPAAQNDGETASNQDDGATGNDSALGGFVPTPVSATDTAAPVATDDLLDIKQEALEALTPLVGQLDQTPEEQFRTTMMMIQASDNHGLVRAAYEAAKKISNEKERAQALLDIVNEINYFTQHAAQA